MEPKGKEKRRSIASSKNEDAFFQAAKGGYADDIQELLSQHKVDVNMQDHLGNTGLHYAASANHLEAVNALLSHQNVNVNLTNATNDTPLHKAVWRGSEEIVSALVAAGADLNAVNLDGKNAAACAKNSKIAALVQPQEDDYPFDSEEEEEDSDFSD
eukprot:CAMPEP_0174262278 /NCGR_PEP_ID=MMETSP0439-20130205/12885_1 /TAXON_ID=0 /ORGANISM="Stereomyxa ramosa, Strain Chinc5" /LENGTH=156 /DNA_ID=CAMNT_0015346967 /DNA_START=30 /DNA_END=500 /DNA_ORIENTATION=+